MNDSKDSRFKSYIDETALEVNIDRSLFTELNNKIKILFRP